MISFHDHMFFDTRKALALATRTDAVRCIAEVQTGVAIALLDQGASVESLMLAKSDIAETLLAKEALHLAAQPGFAALEPVLAREQAMAAHLSTYLLRWMVSLRASAPSGKKLCPSTPAK